MKTTLSNAIFRKKTFVDLLRQAAVFAPEKWGIEDPSGNLIFGKTPDAPTLEQPIFFENEVVGRLKSERMETKFIAALIENWLRQEAGKHQLGAEALHLYREINLIFSFSEKLSATLGTEPIARLTLQEAGQIIRFRSGGVFFLNEKTGKSSLRAGADASFLENPPPDFFEKIIQKGKSEILAVTDSSAEMWLVASMKIGQRLLGGIVLRGENFSAADLKLLSTLAAQTAAALENSVQNERTTAAALKDQREKLTLELAMKNPFFKKIRTIIEARFLEPEFSVGDLAATMHLSISQLQRKIGTMTNLTPVQIIRDLRLARAKSLLLTTDLTVSEVAFGSGFNNPSYFSRLFLKEFGGSPTDWTAAQRLLF